jgi:hypothetical protein
MPKVLYIEDELTKNIPAIRRFFAPILRNKKIVKRFDELESEDRVVPEDILDACKYSTELEICYKFPEALQKIITNYRSYDLIIIDRNLSLYDYSGNLEDIIQMMSSIGYERGEGSILSYHEREGDLLLLVLAKIDKDNMSKTYYLTANTGDDLRGSSELQTLIDIGSFYRNHIIEKGSEREAVISEIISDTKSFKIQNKYRLQCDILREHLTEDDVKNFIETVKHFESDSKKEFVLILRNQIDNLLHHLAHEINDISAPYWNPHNSQQIKVKPFLKGCWMDNIDYSLKGFNKKKNIKYTSIPLNGLLSIFEITSDCGVHEQSKAIIETNLRTEHLTKHTMRTLFHQYMDVILWYDNALRTIKADKAVNVIE